MILHPPTRKEFMSWKFIIGVASASKVSFCKLHLNIIHSYVFLNHRVYFSLTKFIVKNTSWRKTNGRNVRVICKVSFILLFINTFNNILSQFILGIDLKHWSRKIKWIILNAQLLFKDIGGAMTVFYNRNSYNFARVFYLEKDC